MEELGEDPASSSSSKMDQQEECTEVSDAVEGVASITLPEKLQKITPSEEFVSVRHRWNTNEEIASILIAFDKHKEWLVLPQKIRPASGSMLLYNRKVVFYRRDGYCWKKRRNGSTIREDHMKLKVQGLECIYGSYVHSAILPTFHRRCYWLLQNPNIVLLHYLNVPYPETAKPSILSVSSELKRSEWTKEELVDQLRPMLSRVGQDSEHEAHEEGKVEKILEELLPMLMPMHEGEKPVSYPHNLASQSLILTPTSTVISSHPIVPRQSAHLSVFQSLNSSSKERKSTKGKILPAKLQPQTGLKKLQQSSSSQNAATTTPMTSQGFHQPIVFKCHGQGVNLAAQPLIKQQSELQVQGKKQTMATKAVGDLDAIAGITQQGTMRDNINSHQKEVVHSSRLMNEQRLPENLQAVSNNLLANNPSNRSQLQRSSDSDVAMVNAFSTESVVDGQQSGSVTQNQMTSSMFHVQDASSSVQHRLNSSHALCSLASPIIGLPRTTPATSMTLLSESQAPVVQKQLGFQEMHQVMKSGFQQQPNPLNPCDQQQQQHLAQHNHSFALSAVAQQHTPQTANSSLPQQYHMISPQTQQQQQTPLLTLHLKPGDGTSTNSPGIVLSLQGATLLAPESVSTSSSSVSQPTSNITTPPSLNISDPSGLVLVASQNHSGELVLNRISNSHSAQPSILSQPTAPGGPFVQTRRTPGVACVSPSPVMENHKSMDVSSHHVNVNNLPVTMHMSGVSFPPPHSEPLSRNPSSILPASSSQGLQSNCQIRAPSFVATGCETSAGNVLPQGTAGLNVLTTSVPFSTNIKSEKDSVDFLANSYIKDSLKGASSPSSSFDLFTKDCISYAAFGAADHLKNGVKMDVCNVVYAGDHTNQTQQVQQSQMTPHSLADDLMAGPSRVAAKEINNPPSCDTLDGSFSLLPGGDLNLDDLLDLEEVGDLVTSPLSATDIPATPVCNWEVITGGKDTNNGLADSSSCLDLLPLSKAASQGSLDKPLSSSHAGMSMFGFCQQQQHQPIFHPQQQHQQQQQQQLHCSQISPTSPNHPGAPPRSSGLVLTSVSPLYSMHRNNQPTMSDPELNSVIIDFSPEWAYTKSNTKVLVAGPWCTETSQYTCVFDGHHIPAALIQPGLLRCFTPFHGVGYATLQVARDSVVISRSEIFEFRERESKNIQTSHPEWFAFETTKLKLLLFERLDQLQRRLSSFRISLQDMPNDLELMESVLVERVKSLVDKSWSQSDTYPKAGQHNLTLLHLAAALDLAKLISCFIKWRMANSCVALEFEVDALSVDSHSCTPLMWACGLGNIDAALTLYRWNALPLKMCNKDGILPLALARRKGFYNLANQIEQLERAKEEADRKNDSCELEKECFGGDTPLSNTMDVSCPSPVSPGHMMTVVSSPANPSEMPVDVKEQDEVKEEEEVHLSQPLSFPRPNKPGPKLIRRFSEQVIGQSSRTLSKRNSVDLLPSGQDDDQAALPTIGSPLPAPIRESTSEPQLVVSPDMTFVVPPAPRLLLEDEIDEPSCVYTSDPLTSRMDTDEIGPVANSSPIIDVERISSDEELDQGKEDSKHQMVTLANQIIAAIPERIKLSPSKGDDVDDSSSGRGRSESHSSLPSQGSPRPSSFGDDSGISTPMTDSLAFEEYRYPEFGTPASSLSPDSTCLPSPYSPYSFTLDSPPPTTAEFTEYFNAPTTYMEKDFSQLTLSDQEQRKLYEAAKVIQNAYRHYRDKQQQQQLQQQKEIEAAVLIQSYYRRYKTYAYYKKMSHAAVLIQNQFRTYYAKRNKRGDSSASLQGLRRESERLKKGRNQSVIIQQRFRSHYQRKSLDGKEGSSTSQTAGEATESSPPPPQEANSQCPEENQITDVDLKEDDANSQNTQAVLVSGGASGSGITNVLTGNPGLDPDHQPDIDLSMEQSCSGPLEEGDSSL